MPNCWAMLMLPSAWASPAPATSRPASSRVTTFRGDDLRGEACGCEFMMGGRLSFFDAICRCVAGQSASERHVAFHGGAVELAAQVVGRSRRQVGDRAVVPEHQVVRLPVVAVDQLI